MQGALVAVSSQKAARNLAEPLLHPGAQPQCVVDIHARSGRVVASVRLQLCHVCPSNSIARISAPYNPLGFDDEDAHSTCNADTKVAILPNRAVAVFGETIQESIMRAIYFDFAVETMRAIEGMAGKPTVMSDEEVLQANLVWDNDLLYQNFPEVKALRKMMHLLPWWTRSSSQSTPTAMSRTSWSLRRKICRRTQ